MRRLHAASGCHTNMYSLTLLCPCHLYSQNPPVLSSMSMMLRHYTVPLHSKESVELLPQLCDCCRSLLVHDSPEKQYRHYDSSGGSNDAIAERLASQLTRPVLTSSIAALQ